VSALVSSFTAFLKAGVRPRTPLARAIVVALVIKLCVVVTMRIFLFGADQRPVVDEASMDRLFAPHAQSRLP
jgi:hypothetical protein